jgi:hypothetical protein
MSYPDADEAPCCIGYATSGGDDRCHVPGCADAPPPKIPTRAYLPGRGPVRVISYDGNDRFTVLTNRDVTVRVHRDRLSFRK